jgi:hypothetical protein
MISKKDYTLESYLNYLDEIDKIPELITDLFKDYSVNRQAWMDLYHKVQYATDLVPVLMVKGAILGMLIWAYRRYLSNAGRKCAGIQGHARTICIKDERKKALQKSVSIARSKISLCKKSKDPEKCRQKIQNFIIKTEKKAQSMRIV